MTDIIKQYTADKIIKKKLKSIFAHKSAFSGYRMWDSYYMHKCNMTHDQIFSEHFEKFRPSLKEILKKQKLKNTFIQKQKSEKAREKLREYIVSDLNNLLARHPCDVQKVEYLKTIEPSYPNLPKIQQYGEALDKLGDPSKNVRSASEYYCHNSQDVQIAMQEGQFIPPKLSTNVDTAIDLFAQHLNNTPDLYTQNIDAITYYASNHPAFTLVTLEPYMVFILGNTLFFKIFIPLHRDGAIEYFVRSVMQKHLEYTNSFTNRIKRIVNSLPQVIEALTPILNSPVARSSTAASLAAATCSAVYTYTKKALKQTPEQTTEQQTTAQDAADLLLSGEGFNNKYIDATRSFVRKAAYEAGAGVSVIAKGFTEGVVSRHENQIRAAAREVDRYVNEHKNQIKSNLESKAAEIKTTAREVDRYAKEKVEKSVDKVKHNIANITHSADKAKQFVNENQKKN